MVKLYSIFATILVVVGGLLIATVLRGNRLGKDQAGFAYVQTEDGKTVQASDSRPAGRTLPPPKSTDSANPVSPKTGLTEQEWLTRFTLIERSGKKVSSEDLKGQPYLAGFFFATCPSICPRQNEKVKQLQDKFKGQPIRFLSITCDPEVDRPEVLAEYANRFSADKDQWLFLTGDFNYIRRVGVEVFRLPVDRKSHPEKLVLVNAAGDLHGFYTWSDANQWLALQTDIEALLKSPDTAKASTTP